MSASAAVERGGGVGESLRAPASAEIGPPRALHRTLLQALAGRAGGTWVTCAGRSMEPTVRLGDRVRVEAGARVRAGDVILFEALRGGYVLHRVVLRVPGTSWLIHAGDARHEPGPRLLDRLGATRCERVIGRADVPRRRVSWRLRAEALRWLVAAARRRLAA